MAVGCVEKVLLGSLEFFVEKPKAFRAIRKKEAVVFKSKNSSISFSVFCPAFKSIVRMREVVERLLEQGKEKGVKCYSYFYANHVHQPVLSIYKENEKALHSLYFRIPGNKILKMELECSKKVFVKEEKAFEDFFHSLSFPGIKPGISSLFYRLALPKKIYSVCTNRF